MTFSLDRETVGLLNDAAQRLAKPESEIVRDAIRAYCARIGRLPRSTNDSGCLPRSTNWCPRYRSGRRKRLTKSFAKFGRVVGLADAGHPWNSRSIRRASGAVAWERLPSR